MGVGWEPQEREELGLGSPDVCSLVSGECRRAEYSCTPSADAGLARFCLTDDRRALLPWLAVYHETGIMRELHAHRSGTIVAAVLGTEVSRSLSSPPFFHLLKILHNPASWFDSPVFWRRRRQSLDSYGFRSLLRS